MRNMIKSDYNWIGNIPEDWKTLRIKNVAWLKGRIGWDGLKTDEFTDEGPFLITGTDFQDGTINWDTCVHITKERYDEDVALHIKEGDLLITKDGTIGKVAIVKNAPDKVSLNSGVMIIRNNSKFHYDSKYMYYLLNSHEFKSWFTLEQKPGSTIKHLYQHQFAKFYFTYPIIAEQKAIASYLDNMCSKIDEAISRYKGIIEKLKEYKKLVITQAVTKGLNPDVEMKDSGCDYFSSIPTDWDCIKLKNLIRGLTDGTHGTFTRTDFGKPLLSAKNVFEDGLHIGDNESLISEEDFTTITSNGFPQKNDILLCCVGTIGRCMVYDYDETMAFQRSVVFIRTNHLILPQMLKYSLMCEQISTQEQLLVNQSAQAGLYQGAVKQIYVCVPPMQEQEQIVKYLDEICIKISGFISRSNAIIEKLNEYKQSDIYNAVTGKIDCRKG